MTYASIHLEEDDVGSVGLKITFREHGNEDQYSYFFTEWSRQQLLSLLGVREHWFSLVPQETQVKELNVRLHALNDRQIRTMKAVDGYDVRFVRGIVSKQYADLPNASVMDAVMQEAAHDTEVLTEASGITDRAFYAYLQSPRQLTIQGTSFVCNPGVLIRNSDVGYTSLYVIPYLGLNTTKNPAVIEHKTLLKRIHRGNIDLRTEFRDAFAKAALLWSDLEAKLPMLTATTYSSEEIAIGVLSSLLASAGSREGFVQKCVTTYKRVVRKHSALSVFEAVSETCAQYLTNDDRYTENALAGAVLYKLLF